MCTVTFIARECGYAIGMNRDEKLARPVALGPARYRIDGRSVLAPSEPSGGLWIGANDGGATFALINWYGVTARVESQPISRGEIVKSALPLDSTGAVTRALTSLPLSRVNPFRLIGIIPSQKVVVEWRWNLQQLDQIAHAWQTNIWISSGFDEPGAQQTRGKIFRQVLKQESAGNCSWLRSLHRSHAPEPGPYSMCMHRCDAATVSYTEIAILRDRAEMRYVPGSPCCTPALPKRNLRLSGHTKASSPAAVASETKRSTE
jgi:hypothetical protein